jgi:transcriptional regulator with XRE-family HTH domain
MLGKKNSHVNKKRDEMFSIGQRLREERERLNLSQDSLGEALGVDRRVIRNYEGNKTSPRADQLAKMMGLGADILYIVSGKRVLIEMKEPPTGDSSPAEQLATYIRGLTLSDSDAEILRVLAMRLAAGG